MNSSQHIKKWVLGSFQWNQNSPLLTILLPMAEGTRLFWVGALHTTNLYQPASDQHQYHCDDRRRCSPGPVPSHLWNGHISPPIVMPPRLRMHRIHIHVPTSHRWLKCPAHAAMAMVVPPLSLPHISAMVVPWLWVVVLCLRTNSTYSYVGISARGGGILFFALGGSRIPIYTNLQSI